MNIVDCHGNVGWDVSNTRKNLKPTEQTFRELLFKMEQFGVQKAIIVPFPSPGGQFSINSAWYDIENQNLINAARMTDRLIPFIGVNPADERSVDNVRVMVKTHKIKGIKFSHQIPMNFSIDNLINHPLMQIVQDNKLLMMIHVGSGKEAGANHVHTTLNYAIKVAKHYPQVNFIFCHLGRLHWSLLEALQLANVWMDTAGFSMAKKFPHFIAKRPLEEIRNLTPEEIIEKLVGLGYADKLIFGSDEPYTHYRQELEIIKHADISKSDKEKILSKNILGLLKW